MTHINIFLFFLGLLPLNQTNQLDSNQVEHTSSYVTVGESEEVSDANQQAPRCDEWPLC